MKKPMIIRCKNPLEHQSIPGIDFDTLLHIRKSPAHFKFRCKNQPSINFKNLFCHAVKACAFDPEYRPAVGANPGIDAEGNIVVPDRQAQVARMVGDAIISQPFFAELAADADDLQKIASVCWPHPEAGMLKCQVDLLSTKQNPDGSFIALDILMVDDATPSKMVKMMLKHMSAKIGFKQYVLGNFFEKPISVSLLAVEKQAPFFSAPFKLDEYFVRMGQFEMSAMLRKLIDCKKQDAWPGYPNGHRELSPPQWAVDMLPAGKLDGQMADTFQLTKDTPTAGTA